MKWFKIFQHDTWVKPFIKQYAKLLVVVLCLGVITSFCAGALMFTSGYTIDKAATQPANILLIYIPILLTRAFGIARPVIKYLERLKSHNWVLKVTSKLRQKLYNQLEKEAVFLEERYQSGQLLGLLSEDINHLQNMYLRSVFPTVIAYLLATVIVIGLGWFSLFYAFIIALLLLVEILVIPLISLSIQASRRYQQKQIKAQLYTDLGDNLFGLTDWMIANRRQDFLAHTKQTSDNLRQNITRSRRFSWRRDWLIQIVYGVIAVVLLIFTNQVLTDNQQQANWVSAFVLALFPLTEFFTPISQSFEDWPIYSDSVNRLNALPQLTVPVPSEDITIDQFSTLTLDHVSFQYPKSNECLLADFSLSITAGQNVAIIGPSGAGKSTLFDLILGDLTPQSGTIKINDTEVSQLQASRPQLFSVLEQKPFLFNTSIINNVRLGNEKASDQAVINALKRVGLAELIEQLPQQYETSVAEAGSRFSGGEQQRLALARILLQDAPIVLLDEPTVGLDPITEKALLETCFSVLKHKTIIWITHHLQGMSEVDQVVFLKDGQIEMSGQPQQLYQNNAHFKKLYQMDQGL